MKKSRLCVLTAATVVAALGPVPAEAQTAPVTSVASRTVAGLTGENTVITFDAARPTVLLSERSITGLAPGERLLGMDVRPANQRLYALGSANNFYTLNPTTGQASPVARLSVGLIGDDIGFDFNPVVDRIRITTNGSQNLRVNPDTGVAIVDGRLTYSAGDRYFGSGARVVASAYTNNVAGAATTQLFNLDADHNNLALQTPPNDGGLSTVGQLGFDMVDMAGFDIAADGTALAAVGSGGPTQLRSVNLSTGTSVKIGDVGTYRYLRDIAILK